MEDVLGPHVAGIRLGGISVDSNGREHLQKKSDGGTFNSYGNLEEASAGSSGTNVTTGNQVAISTKSYLKTSQQVGP